MYDAILSPVDALVFVKTWYWTIIYGVFRRWCVWLHL